MKKISLIFFFLPFLILAQKQVPFTGKLVYSIEVVDTNFREIFKPQLMTIYTNDTIVRIENHTESLGNQVSIEHIALKKSYILIQTAEGNFAIKTDFNQNDTTPSKYAYKKKIGKRKILDLKANRLKVNHPDFKTEKEFLYIKNHSAKYIHAFNHLPGLPVKYFVLTQDGLFKYELIQYEKYVPNRDLFGVPSDYKRVTIDEFMEIILNENGNKSEH